MADLVFAASLVLAAAIGITGTWNLLRLRRQYRTEVERDRRWDEEHSGRSRP